MRGEVFQRFLVVSVLLHGALLAGFQFGGWNPVPIQPAAPKGFETARARVVLERMKTADPPPVTPALREDPAATGPAVVDVTDRYVAPVRGGSLAPENLNEILDKPLAGDEPVREPTRAERGPGSPGARSAEPGDLERAWRESSQDLPSTGSAGRGNSRSGGSGGGGSGTIATEGFAIGGRGEVPRALVERALGKRLGQMQNCYQTALLENPALSGKVLLRWTVSESGDVEEVLIEKSQLDNAELHSCIVQEIAKTQFPKPKGGSIILRYPLNFLLKTY